MRVGLLHPLFMLECFPAHSLFVSLAGRTTLGNLSGFMYSSCSWSGESLSMQRVHPPTLRAHSCPTCLVRGPAFTHSSCSRQGMRAGWLGEHRSDFTHSSPMAVNAQGLPTHSSSLCTENTMWDGLNSLSPLTWNISGNTGLVSAGRINKDTPPLTTPGHTSKSSAMDISSHIFQIAIRGATHRRFRLRGDPHLMRLGPEGLSVFL